MGHRLYLKALLTALSLVVFGYIIFLAFSTGFLQFNYPSRADYPVQGIDVSHHQGDIAWAQLDKQQVQFVFIKATEGATFKDPSFKKNWDTALQQGFPVGAYHFFTLCKSGMKQAQNFIATVPYLANALPPVIDLEFGGNCNTQKSKTEILNQLTILENTLWETYHKKPIFYVTQEFYNDYLIGLYPKNPIWFRDVFKRPHIVDNRPWLFWQFAARAHIQGIQTYVDLNVFNGTVVEFKMLVNSTKTE